MKAGNRIVVSSRRALLRPAFSLMAGALAIVAASPSAVAAQAPGRAAQSSAVAGNWSGQFLGSAFTFEFRQVGPKWTGRYHSTKSGKWNSLNNVAVTGGNVRFEFSSQPRVVVSLKNSGPNTLAGAADVAGDQSMGATKIPMTLTRSAGAR